MVLECPGNFDVHVGLQVVFKQFIVCKVLQVGRWQLFKLLICQLDAGLLHLLVGEEHFAQSRLQVLRPQSLLQDGEVFGPTLLNKIYVEGALAELLGELNPHVEGVTAVRNVALCDPLFGEIRLFLGLDYIDELILKVLLLLEKQFLRG